MGVMSGWAIGVETEHHGELREQGEEDWSTRGHF